MKRWISFVLCICMLTGAAMLSGCGGTAQTETTGGNETAESTGDSSGETTTPQGGGEEPDDSLREQLRAQFLAEADKVIVTDEAVTFSDASVTDGGTITIAKNPEKTLNLYASFTTLWYEAGGTVIGCIGGSSSVELYRE